MRRSARFITIGAVLSVLLSMFIAVPAQAVPIAVTNTCTGNVCTDTSLVNIRGIASAPLVVKYNLGSFGCNDNGFICGSARTSGVTATSIEWKWEQQNAFNQWDGTSTIVSHTCTSTASSTSTYCADGQHIDQLVISGLSSVKIIRVQFRLVNGADTTSWMAGRAGASEYEYVVPSTFVPTAAISAAMFLEVNESFTASAENSVANDGYSDLSQSRFSWDFYSTNLYDVSNTASPTYAYAYSRSGTHTMKLRISNYHSVTDTETRVVYVSNVSPSSTASVSLQGGGIWTNTTRPTLEISWPRYAMTMNLADQDRSASNMEVRSSVDWDVTWGSGSGETKNITIDFLKGDGNSVGDQLTTAVSYDIDTPLLNSATATRTDGALSFSLSATDQHSGVSKVEISNGSTTVEHSYATVITSTLSGSNFTVRVKDLAGNWSEPTTVVASIVNTPAPSQNINQSATTTPVASSDAPSAVAYTTPRVAPKSKSSGASIASQAGIPVSPGSKVGLSVSKASKKICKVSGGKLVALAPGNCLVTVSVTPKKTKILKKPKAVKTPTTVVVG